MELGPGGNTRLVDLPAIPWGALGWHDIASALREMHVELLCRAYSLQPLAPAELPRVVTTTRRDER
jgi:hypothetical protein